MRPRKVKIPLSTGNKRRFSKWVLDNVENWPKFQGGIINQLQVDRNFQRKNSDDTFEITKPPEGISFTFLGFRLFEVFFLEDFDILEKGVLDLYNGSNSDFIADRLKIDFPNIKQSIWFGGYQNLGYICRPNQFFGGNVIRRMELPEGVDFINVSFQKNLPSMITICFDVFLTSRMVDRIQAAQRKKYLPDFFIDTIYLQPLFLSTTTSPVEEAQRNAVLSEIEEIRWKVEKIFSPFIKGYFYKTASTKTRFPAIEIYLLKGENQVYKDFQTFANEHKFWFDSLGFRFFFAAFKNEFMIFYESGVLDKPSDGDPISAQYKIILFEEPSMAWLGLQDDKTPSRILLTFDHYLEKLTLPLALISVQNNEQTKVEKLRGKIFRTFIKKRFSRNLNITFNEFNEVQTVLRMIERLTFDYEQAKKWLTKELTVDDGRDLVGFLPNRETKEPRKFSDHLLAMIEGNNKVLVDHLTFLEKHFSRHVELINIEAIYNLQFLTAVLALGAFILGIVGVIAGWESILKTAITVYHFFQKILVP